jgi:uncharacterized membrane protein
VNLSTLWRGLPGHPIHPPLTDATIGIYTFATVAALLSGLGIAEDGFAHGWWLALVVGLVVTGPTALTGLLEWLGISRRTPLKRTATWHALSMFSATVCFLIAAVAGYDGYQDDAVSAFPFVVTLLGFGLLTLGGWLGGAIVFVHGMRVLNLVDEPSARAVSPVPHPEKEAAQEG